MSSSAENKLLRRARGVPLLLISATLVLCTSTNGRAQTSADNALSAVRLEQRLGATVPLRSTWKDETGEAVELGRYFEDRPVVLVPVFYQCRMLCAQVLSAVVRSVSQQTLAPGDDFDVIVFSIDPDETPTLAAEKKLRYLERSPNTGDPSGWHFLTGSAASIESLTDAIGFHYARDAETGQLAHPAAVVVLTPDGTISRYLLGLDYKPRDLRLSVVESSRGEIGSVSDQILLRCFAYDPIRGRYGLAIMTAIRVGAGLTLLGVVALVWFMNRRRAPSTGPKVGGEQ